MYSVDYRFVETLNVNLLCNQYTHHCINAIENSEAFHCFSLSE
jgi:hypothetical protein